MNTAKPQAFNHIAIALLAGGLSSRYANGDKLTAMFNGKPLIQHAAEAIISLPAAARFAVVAKNKPQLTQPLAAVGFKTVITDGSPHGMGHSIAKAAQAALATPAEALLVCLADMPFITAGTLQQLNAALVAQPAATIAICTRGGKSELKGDIENTAPTFTPPVLFRRSHFAELTTLTGDNGGKALIERHMQNVVSISLTAEQCRDFDTVADFTMM